MDSRMRFKFLPVAVLSLTAAAIVIAGCSGGASIGNTNTQSSSSNGSSFVIGTDAPMASVVSFSVPVQSVTATDSNNNTIQLVSGTPTVDFARFNGLQTLLDMNDVPAGTYTSISVTLGTATIGYLQTAANAAPAIETLTATYPNSAATFTYTETLTNPLVVTSPTGSPVGLRVDLNLRKTITTDGSGNIQPAVTPTFNITTVGPDDAGAYIDEFDAGVISVGTQSFIVQGPHGRQWTINVSGQTEWENNEGLSNLTTSSIVQISGELDKADSTINADDVAILSQSGFYAAGQITYVQPSSGQASSFDLYVRGLLPADTPATLGQITTVDLSGNEKYFIYWFHNPLTKFLFNSSALIPGQHVAVGGPAAGVTANSVSGMKRVVLRHWGFNGTVTSVDSGNGTFQITVNGFAGLLVPQTVTVYTGSPTRFRDGFSDLGDVSVGANVRVVGLLLKDPTSGNTVLLAHYVDELN